MTVELLAPAKNESLGKLAINCGADAVYIGAKKFSARKEAHNTVADIERLCNYAHRYQAKVYVALNTTLTDAEVQEAQELLWQLYEVGADGVIIQDMGLIEIGMPPMPIIASTQTHNFDKAGVAFLEQAGFHRAILARELWVEEIAEIRAGTQQIQLECFVHGALCASYSGRCYLSYAQGGRSANRGNCAQPCRKMYTLEDGRGNKYARGHLLSVKDLCRISHLAALLDAGVTSFKIEGRLKGAPYVINTVWAYRRALDELLEKRNLVRCQDVFDVGVVPDLNKTFNRGYVHRFAVNNDSMATFKTPKMRGELMGKVVSVGGDEFEIDSLHDFCGGDGICFFGGDKLVGTRVQKVIGKKVVVRNGGEIRVGMDIYRNLDMQFVGRLEKSHLMRKVPIDITLESSSLGWSLRVGDASGNQVTKTLDGPFEHAQNPNAARAGWKKQLKKTGDTEFVCRDLMLPQSDLPFARLSRINQWRRDALVELRHLRMERWRRNRNKYSASAIHHPKVYFAVDVYFNVTNEYAATFYRKCGATSVSLAIENGGTDVNGVQLMTSKYCLRRELGACLKQRKSPNIEGPLYLVDEGPPTVRLLLRFDCRNCQMYVCPVSSDDTVIDR